MDKAGSTNNPRTSGAGGSGLHVREELLRAVHEPGARVRVQHRVARGRVTRDAGRLHLLVDLAPPAVFFDSWRKIHFTAGHRK